jgi:NTE family protein
MTSPADAPVPAAADDRSTRPIDLVLEGGGVKGIALAGAIEVLEERGYRINRVAGTSAGAIAGSLVAYGVPSSKIVQILRETDYRSFQNRPWWARGVPGAIISLMTRFGIYRTTALAAWLEEQLAANTEQLAANTTTHYTGTFADLRYQDPEASETGPDAGPEQFRLIVTASDLSAGRLRFLPQDADDLGIDPAQLRVVDAVCASSSIPLFFRPARWRNTGGRTSFLVDGGILSNFPVSVFDREDEVAPRWPTIGVKLSARPESPVGTVNRITGPISFGKAVVNTVTGFYDRQHIDDSHAVARTIFIDTESVRPTQFDLSEQERESLYQKGRRAAAEFLDGTETRPAWDFDRYVDRFRTRRR